MVTPTVFGYARSFASQSVSTGGVCSRQTRISKRRKAHFHFCHVAESGMYQCLRSLLCWKT